MVRLTFRISALLQISCCFSGLCRSHAGTVVATADDFGKVGISTSFSVLFPPALFDLGFSQVKLFKWPCVAKAPVFRQYCGHSSHVRSVRFTKSDQYLVLAIFRLSEAISCIISHRGARSPSEGQTCLSSRCRTPRPHLHFTLPYASAVAACPFR
jgi:hypothetical protein